MTSLALNAYFALTSPEAFGIEHSSLSEGSGWVWAVYEIGGLSCPVFHLP
jgi:hypothetical protein